jgi:hypothetical protein
MHPNVAKTPPSTFGEQLSFIHVGSRIVASKSSLRLLPLMAPAVQSTVNFQEAGKASKNRPFRLFASLFFATGECSLSNGNNASPPLTSCIPYRSVSIARALPAAHSGQRSAQIASTSILRTSIIARLRTSSATVWRNCGAKHKALCQTNLSISSHRKKKIRPHSVTRASPAAHSGQLSAFSSDCVVGHTVNVARLACPHVLEYLWRNHGVNRNPPHQANLPISSHRRKKLRPHSIGTHSTGIPSSRTLSPSDEYSTPHVSYRKTILSPNKSITAL